MPDLGPLWLSLLLALATTAILLAFGTPLAWWLATTRSTAKPYVEALTAMPLVLPPTVIGFYLLLVFNPSSPVGGARAVTLRFRCRATGADRALSITESIRPDEEAYLIKLSSLIRRRQAVPKAFFNLAQPVAAHESLRRFPLLVLQFRLAPGAAIPYHDHRDYNGVLTVTEGALRIRSFEILGSDPRYLNVAEQPSDFAKRVLDTSWP